MKIQLYFSLLLLSAGIALISYRLLLKKPEPHILSEYRMETMLMAVGIIGLIATTGVGEKLGGGLRGGASAVIG